MENVFLRPGGISIFLHSNYCFSVKENKDILPTICLKILKRDYIDQFDFHVRSYDYSISPKLAQLIPRELWAAIDSRWHNSSFSTLFNITYRYN